jgi:hypothetical protein
MSYQLINKGIKKPLQVPGLKKAGELHRTAQPPTLAAFRPWEGSAGAGRVRPAAANIQLISKKKIKSNKSKKVKKNQPN